MYYVGTMTDSRDPGPGWKLVRRRMVSKGRGIAMRKRARYGMNVWVCHDAVKSLYETPLNGHPNLHDD